MYTTPSHTKNSTTHIQSQILTSLSPDALTIQCLDKFYLLHWNREYLEFKINSKERTITHQDVTYIVILVDDTAPLSRSQCRVSFRKPRPHVGLPPVVLIGV